MKSGGPRAANTISGLSELVRGTSQQPALARLCDVSQNRRKPRDRGLERIRPQRKGAGRSVRGIHTTLKARHSLPPVQIENLDSTRAAVSIEQERAAREEVSSGPAQILPFLSPCRVSGPVFAQASVQEISIFPYQFCPPFPAFQEPRAVGVGEFVLAASPKSSEKNKAGAK